MKQQIVAFLGCCLVFLAPAHLSVKALPESSDTDASRILRAKAAAQELENLQKQNDIINKLRTQSEQREAVAKREMVAARTEASRAVLATQKAKQGLERKKLELEEKRKKFAEEQEAKRVAEEQKRIETERLARKDEEQKAAVTGILSDLFDARKIGEELPKIATLEAMQAKLRELEAIRNRAVEKNSKVFSLYNESLPQAEQGLKDIDDIITKARERLSALTIQTATTSQA